MSHGMYKLS